MDPLLGLCRRREVLEGGGDALDVAGVEGYCGWGQCRRICSHVVEGKMSHVSPEDIAVSVSPGGGVKDYDDNVRARSELGVTNVEAGNKCFRIH